METLNNTENTNNKLKLYCDYCDFTCYKKYSWKRHISTIKHKIAVETVDLVETIKTNSIIAYICDYCNKEYNDRSGLWRHKNKCSNKKKEIDKDEIIKILLNHTNKLMDLVENGNNNTTNNNTTNNNLTNIKNNTFNLNIFLNETCKDAMNISEFVSSIKLNLEDLEHTGKRGYIEGISNIILKNLNNIEQHLRPLHCSDPKREIIYIKDNNEWTKESEEKIILTKAIKTIANENIKQITNWKDKYPDCLNVDSNKNNMYLKIVCNSMSGGTNEECEKNINKIVSNVAKEVTINKY
jgi:hypothetical protein